MARVAQSRDNARMPVRRSSLARVALGCVLLLAVSLLPAFARAQPTESQRSALTGYWKGQLECAGSRSWFAIEFVAADSGRMNARMTLPAIRGYDFDLGPARLAHDSVFAGPFSFAWDAARGHLRGVLPRAVVPVHELAVDLVRGDPLAREPRAPFTAPVRSPAWTFDAGAPLWADLEAGSGLVYAGGDDGVLHALDARSGRERWRFRTGGRLRARPALVASSLYVQSDDGWLYRLDANRGTRRWRVRVMPDSVVRVPIDQPGSRYDFYASAVTAANGSLFVGTHAGRVLALDPATGETLWEATTGGPVLSAPGVAGGRVFVGSYDGRVYAFDAFDGHALWTHDTGAPVTSTPVPEQGVVVVGSRSYDLFGLDAASGDVRWAHYIWFSWIESSARVENGVAYVGSSDASRIYALDAKNGVLHWESDVHGISWGRPALAADRVYVAVRFSPSIETHEANLIALDRATGEPVWRYPCDRPAGATHRGFAASPVVYRSRVFVGGLDGKVYAFPVRDPRPRARR
jgi:eukaryotic-like serine/threonine-protein kinase